MIAYRSCRELLSVDDVNFVVRTLAATESAREKAFELFVSDPDSRDLMLDAAPLYFAVTDPGSKDLLHTSPYLYFYVVVRNLLRDLNVDDRLVADYVAEVLGSCIDLQFSATYVFDMVQEEQQATSAHEQTAIKLRNAETLLMLTGLFHEFLERRRVRHGAPGAYFYAKVGASKYRELSKSSFFNDSQLCHSFDVMGEEMPRITACLHGIVR